MINHARLWWRALFIGTRWLQKLCVAKGLGKVKIPNVNFSSHYPDGCRIGATTIFFSLSPPPKILRQAQKYSSINISTATSKRFQSRREKKIKKLILRFIWRFLRGALRRWLTTIIAPRENRSEKSLIRQFDIFGENDGSKIRYKLVQVKVQ